MLNYYVYKTSFSGNVIFGQDGWLFYSDKNDGDKGLLKEHELEEIENNLLEAQYIFEEQGIEFVVFIAPNKERVYHQKMPEYYGSPAEDYAVKQLVDYLQINTDIKVVYPVEELCKAAEELGDNAVIYHKTDTHWNELGAYIGVRELMEVLSIEWPDYKAYELKIIEVQDTAGDLAGMLQLTNAGLDVGNTYHIQDLSSEFEVIANDFWKGYIYRSAEADPRRIFVLRDSFGTAMAELIGSQFTESVLWHRKTYEQSYVDEFKPDVFVLESVERYAVQQLKEFEFYK